MRAQELLTEGRRREPPPHFLNGLEYNPLASEIFNLVRSRQSKNIVTVPVREVPGTVGVVRRVFADPENTLRVRNEGRTQRRIYGPVLLEYSCVKGADYKKLVEADRSTLQGKWRKSRREIKPEDAERFVIERAFTLGPGVHCVRARE